MEQLKNVGDSGIIGFSTLLNIISAAIAAGLLVAIPSVALYNFLLGKAAVLMMQWGGKKWKREDLTTSMSFLF